MIKAILLDYAGVIRQQGDLLENIVELCDKDFTIQKAKEIYDQAKINTIPEKKYLSYFSEEGMNWLYKMITIHSGLMDFLEKNTMPVYIASNYITGIIEKEIDILGVRNYFSKIFVSDKMKVAKPSKEFYYKILSELGLKPNEVIFVDDQKKNLKPLKEIGITSVWVNNTKIDSFGNNSDVIPDYEIYEISELLEIINNTKKNKLLI